MQSAARSVEFAFHGIRQLVEVSAQIRHGQLVDALSRQFTKSPGQVLARADPPAGGEEHELCRALENGRGDDATLERVSRVAQIVQHVGDDVSAEVQLVGVDGWAAIESFGPGGAQRHEFDACPNRGALDEHVDDDRTVLRDAALRPLVESLRRVGEHLEGLALELEGEGSADLTVGQQIVADEEEIDVARPSALAARRAAADHRDGCLRKSGRDEALSEVDVVHPVILGRAEGLGHNGTMAREADVTLEDIATELYALPPKEFTAARDARAKQLADAARAKRVRALRKPLLAAWVVNLFAREQAAALRGALELASELREAQDDLDARALSALGRQRRALVGALAQQASELASARGEKITPATTDAVEQTLNAAMFRADAALAVASGRLIRPLDAAGEDSAEVSDAVAGDLDVASAAVPAPTRPDELAARRARKAAEDELRSAERALKKAEQDRDALERKAKSVAEKSERLSARIEELEQELERTRQELKGREQESDEVDALRGDARERLHEAQQDVSTAQKAIDRL